MHFCSILFSTTAWLAMVEYRPCSHVASVNYRRPSWTHLCDIIYLFFFLHLKEYNPLHNSGLIEHCVFSANFSWQTPGRFIWNLLWISKVHCFSSKLLEIRNVLVTHLQTSHYTHLCELPSIFCRYSQAFAFVLSPSSTLHIFLSVNGPYF